MRNSHFYIPKVRGEIGHSNHITKFLGQKFTVDILQGVYSTLYKTSLDLVKSKNKRGIIA